jgi:hypothetical protein
MVVDVVGSIKAIPPVGGSSLDPLPQKVLPCFLVYVK